MQLREVEATVTYVVEVKYEGNIELKVLNKLTDCIYEKIRRN